MARLVWRIRFGQVLPTGPGLQDPEDAVQDGPGILPRPSSVIRSARRLRDQGLEYCPLLIREVHAPAARRSDVIQGIYEIASNILLNHVLSSHIYDILPRVTTITRLSRISILELEALAHRDDKGNYTNKPSVNKRNSIWAFVEVRKFLDGGAQLLPPIDWSIIMNFSNIAGKGFSDKAIRQELSTYPQSSELVLLTNDFINALTGMAELGWLNIEVFYISDYNPNETSFTVDNERLSHVLMEASISYAQIKLKNAQSNEIYMTIEGMWSGKTWYDFHLNRIYVTRQ